MKLNPDCVRSLMLYLEENLDLNDSIDIKNISLDGFDEKEIIYSADKLLEANLISAYKQVAWGGNIMYFDITAITASGCSFLDTIRGSSAWKKIKDKAIKLGVSSLSTLMQIATAVVTEIVKGSIEL